MTKQKPDVREIFYEAIAHETSTAIAAYLDGVCRADEQLRAQLEGLLAAHHDAGNFMKKEPADMPQTMDSSAAIRPGAAIGPYKIREQIGEGGFGVVYVAEQEKPIRRKVALKVIKPGMDTKDVIARFEAERQALALMDHPNVAHVYDAGTTENGYPYFVLELVHGVPVTEFCDKNKMSTEDRLRLFVDICRAVQHAHQKGIIHRDIKPSNIMVTLHDGVPVPKVIDFGVSKALSQQLTEKTIYTAYGQMIGTPTYMSPEQAEMSGLGIDTRSDIYSLGVLLYELLTGKTPLDIRQLREEGYAEMLRIIRESEPARPSLKISTLGDEATVIAQQRHTGPQQLRRKLRGELDWIVMKCLDKDRARRYETTVGLIRDVEAYLHSEPVEACPPSIGYRLRKYTRRHKSFLAAATVALAIMLAGTIVSLGYATRARQAAGQAQAERAKAEHNLNLSESERMRAEENLSMALESLDQLCLQAVGRDRLLDRDDRRLEHVPLSAETKRLLETGLKFYERLAVANEESSDVRFRGAEAYMQIGNLQNELRNDQASQAAFERAIELLESHSFAGSGSPDYFLALGGAYHALARIARYNAGSELNTVELERKARGAYDKCLVATPDDTDALVSRAMLLDEQLKTEEAIKDLERALQLAPKSARFHWAMACVLTWYDGETALQYAQRAVQLAPDRADYVLALGMILKNLRRFDEGERQLRRHLELAPHSSRGLETLSALFRDRCWYEKAVLTAEMAIEANPNSAFAYYDRACALDCLGETQRALADLDQAVRLRKEPFLYLKRGEMLFKLGRYRDMKDNCDRAIALSPETHSKLFCLRATAQLYLGDYRGFLEDIKVALQNKPSRLPWGIIPIPTSKLAQCDDLALREHLEELAERLVEAGNDSAGVYLDRGRIRIGLGQIDGAMSDFTRAVEFEPSEVNLLYQIAVDMSSVPELDRPAMLRAVEWAEEAASLRQDDVAVLVTLGVAYYRAGSWQKSVDTLQNAIDLDNVRDSWKLFPLAMANERIGHRHDAVEIFRQAVDWMEAHAPQNDQLMQYREEGKRLILAD